MQTDTIHRMVTLESSDYRAVRHFANQLGLGSRGFSAALRIIVREWTQLNQILSPEIIASIRANSKAAETK